MNQKQQLRHKENMRHSTQLKEILEREIVTGQIKPGERLEELEIANRFGVSRTPVREALAMLEAINLVKRKPRQGVIVVGITLRAILQMLEVLAKLEGICGELAAKRMDSKARKGLQARQDALEDAALKGDPDIYYDRIIDYHRYLFDATGNDILVEHTESVAGRLEPFLRAQHHQRGGIKRSLHDHRRITEAAIAGDEQLTAELILAHIHLDTRLFADFVSRVEMD